MRAVDRPDRRLTLRTYSHLLGARRIPSEYEITTSQLLYYVGRGFEVRVPVASWYERYQRGSPLGCPDWEQFHDPRATTYSEYTRLQQAQEIFVDGLLQSIEGTEYDRKLAPEWLGVLARTLAPLRYPLHGLQMAAAYVGQMAPSGRIVICALLQAADEVRRIERISQRMAQLRRLHSGFGDDAPSLWLSEPSWQPLRETIERLLVTWDFGEALVALGVCVKPALDRVLRARLAERAVANGDYLWAQILAALDEDAKWQRTWTGALLRLVVGADAHNLSVVRGWLDKWHPPARRAAATISALWGDEPAQVERWLEAEREIVFSGEPA